MVLQISDSSCTLLVHRLLLPLPILPDLNLPAPAPQLALSAAGTGSGNFVVCLLHETYPEYAAHAAIIKTAATIKAADTIKAAATISVGIAVAGML